MKKLGLLVLVLGCSSSSSSKQPPTPATPEPAPAAPAEPTAKQEPPPAPAPEPAPDTGGYRLVAPSALQFQAADPSKPGLKLPAGAKPGLHSHTADYHAVLISGAHKHWQPGEEKKAKVLAPGSYWYQPGKQAHGDECTGSEPCIVY